MTKESIIVNQSALEKTFFRVSQTADHSHAVNKIADGPKTRGSERKHYILIDGEVNDVYKIILKAIALNPPQLTMRYQNLQDRIKKICQSDFPSGSSVTGSCENIALIANSCSEATLIEWDSENDVLDIRDPYLLFHIRWGCNYKK